MITSKTNELIKHIKSLHQKKYREEFGEYFVEGKKLVLEAIQEKVDVQKIIICEDLFKENLNFPKYDVEYVNENVFNFISDTKAPQGILAVIKTNKKAEIFGDIIFALDDIQDPGNLGTIIRTLDCAGINTLLLSNGTVDAYNPKTIRSTMGAIYRVNAIENLDLAYELQKLKTSGYKVVVTHLNTNKKHYDLDFNEKLVIVIGNEAKGVSEEINNLADIRVKIPMLGRTESLNASVAASLMAYEYVRYKEFKN